MRGRFLFVFLSMLFFPCNLLAEEQRRTFVIGFIGALSGPAAVYGIAARNGIEMALDELDLRDSFTVLYEDDQFEPRRTVSAFHKLAGRSDVDLIISIASTPSHAVAPLAQSRQIPLFAWASDSAVALDREFVVRTYPSGHDEGRGIAIGALKREYEKVGLVVSINDYPYSVREGFMASFPEERIVVNEDFSPDVNDFKPFLTRVRGRSIDAFFVCLNPGLSGLFSRQVRELNMSAKFFGCENFNSQDEVELSGGAMKDGWFVSVDVTDSFSTRYVERFGNDNVLSGAAVHYDLIKLLSTISPITEDFSLIEKVIEVEPLDGALGTSNYRRSENDRYLEAPLSIIKITDSGFKTLDVLYLNENKR